MVSQWRLAFRETCQSCTVFLGNRVALRLLASLESVPSHRSKRMRLKRLLAVPCPSCFASERQSK
jgi:hypothetical protein